MDVCSRSTRLSDELHKHSVDCKDYGSRKQITRLGLSIPSTIAEGSKRDSKKDLNCFFRYGKGSFGELKTHIYIGMDIGYIQPEKGKIWIQETRELSASGVFYHVNSDLTDN